MKYFKTNRKIAIALLTFLSLSLNSCILDDEVTDFGKGPVLATFSETETEVNIIKNAANTPVDYEFDITYIGGRNVALDKDVTLTIATSPTSEAKEGVEFELPIKTFTIPAGETSATASIKILTAGLVPFDFKDIVLEIVDSSVSIAEKNTITITVKTLGANSLAGRYEILTGDYWRLGVPQASFATSGGGIRVIEAINETTYKHTEYVGSFTGQTWYFTVSDDNKVTVLTKDPITGADILLNGFPIITCESSPSGMSNAKCGSSNFVTRTNDRHDVITLSVGYNTTTGAVGPREFFEVIRRLE